MHKRTNKHADTFPAFPIRKSDERAARDGVICRQPLRVAGASRTHIGVTGIGVPFKGGIMGRVTAAFLCPMVRFMAGRVRGEKSPPLLLTVRQPQPDRHPIGVGRRDTTRQEKTIMTTSHQGEIRPNSGAPSANIQPEVLNSALIGVDSISALLECHQRGWNMLTAADLTLIVENLRSLADKLESGHE